MKIKIIALALGLIALPAPTLAAFDVDLRYGSSGAEVLELQEFLTAEGVYTGPITGNFYSLTLAGVKAFQTRESISPVSGFFGPLTRGKANTLLAEELIESDAEASSTPAVVTPDKPRKVEVDEPNLGVVDDGRQERESKDAAAERRVGIARGEVFADEDEGVITVTLSGWWEDAEVDIEVLKDGVLVTPEWARETPLCGQKDGSVGLATCATSKVYPLGTYTIRFTVNGSSEERTYPGFSRVEWRTY